MCACYPHWRLIDAIERNDVADVRQMLESGVDPNPSKRALKRWEDKPIRIPIFAALYCPTASILQLLLGHGANPHLQMHQHYKSRTVVPHRGLSREAPCKQRKSGIAHHKVSVLHHLIGMSCGNRIPRSYSIDLSSPYEHFFDMYKILRAHLELTLEDQKLLETYSQYNGERQARLYLQWEDNSRQRQEILNNIEIPKGLQAKRKL